MPTGFDQQPCGTVQRWHCWRRHALFAVCAWLIQYRRSRKLYRMSTGGLRQRICTRHLGLRRPLSGWVFLSGRLCQCHTVRSGALWQHHRTVSIVLLRAVSAGVLLPRCIHLRRGDAVPTRFIWRQRGCRDRVAMRAVRCGHEQPCRRLQLVLIMRDVCRRAVPAERRRRVLRSVWRGHV